MLALVFLRSFFDTPGNTARQALLPELAEAAGWTLERANALWLDAASFLIPAFRRLDHPAPALADA